MTHALLSCALVVAAIALQPYCNEVEDGGRAGDQAALKPYGALVGSWRGTGIVKRGSAKGAWTEKAEWVWKLDNTSAALSLRVEKGRYLKQASLVPAGEAGAFRLVATLADDSPRTFQGKAGERNVLVMVADPPAESGLSRVTITPLHENRTLILLEAATEQADRFTKLGEVGYTREGVAFAVGDSAPECVVTGGRGTIAVTHDGKTYYVCCTGCRDLFNEDPKAILAEYRERSKKP